MNIVPLAEHEEPLAVDIFCAAFHDDPVMNWICDKPDFLQAFFKLTLPVFMIHKLSYKDEEARGGAVWLGPGSQLKWPLTPGNMFKLLRVAGLGGVFRLMQSGNKTEKLHPTKPHYYLFLIGARPESAGQGVGSALMSQMLRRCDAENMPAYLENSKRENLRFYQGHGFKVMEEICFAKGAPSLWLMWREPNSQPIINPTV